MGSNIEDRLKFRIMTELVPDSAILYVNEDEWQAICELYRLRGESEPKKPLIVGVPIVRKSV